MPPPPATAVRDHLVRALEADLVGPFDLDHAETSCERFNAAGLVLLPFCLSPL